MNKGTIFYHKKFEFSDGETGRKLLILLNEPQGNEPYLFCKTTSKKKYNLENEGCYSDKNIYILLPGNKCFNKKTWVQFHELYEISINDLLKAKCNGNIEIKSKLDKRTIHSLILCITKSEDISNYHLSLLEGLQGFSQLLQKFS